MKEIWKEIFGFEGLYAISNHGRVKKVKDDSLVKQFSRKGFNVVCLTTLKEGRVKSYYRRVAYLVARHYIPNENNYKYVSHINGNKQDNHIDNLVWNEKDADSKRYEPLSNAKQMRDKGYRKLYGTVDVDLGNYGIVSGEDAYRCFKVWSAILARCYNKRTIEAHPTYEGCYINESWKTFDNFYKWYKENYREGCHLDKDIIKKGNKEYGPDYCCFVPQYINSLLNKRRAKRGNLPIGVALNTGPGVKKYVANIRKYGRLKKIGRYNTPEEAFVAYKREKEKYLKEIAGIAYVNNEIDERTYDALLSYNVEISD